MKSSDARIGYLLVINPTPSAYIGGVMVVDKRGLPLEFRYTEPVQPSKIQQILYGSALSHHVKNEVILETLLKSLESQPQLLIVNDDSFLLKENSLKDFEVVRLTETKSPPLNNTAQNYEVVSNNEILLQLTIESAPIRVQMGQDSSQEPASSGAVKSLPDKSTPVTLSDFENSNAYKILLESGKLMDPLEPLKRVEKALNMLCQEAGLKVATN